MDFIQIAYCVTIPFLFILTWVGRQGNQYFFRNLIAVSNFLLIGYAIFLVRQMLGLYHLSKVLHIDYMKMTDGIGMTMVRLLLIVFLPLFSLLPFTQKSRFFCLLILGLLYWNNPVFTWNTYDLFTKIPAYFSLLCSAYALLWLLNKLPYQFRTA
ncbi:MAG: hypothetical protein ABIS69_08080 [Sediminibacterium sp.]